VIAPAVGWAPASPVPSARFVRTLYRNRTWLWLVPLVPAAGLTGLIMFVLPPDQTLDNLAELVFRLSPFPLAVLGVALFPRVRSGPTLLVVAVVVFMGLVDTEMMLRFLAFGDAPEALQRTAFQPVYQFQLFTATFVVLLALLAFRLGGARTATVLKVGIAAVLVVISGLNDVTFWALNSWPNGRPSAFHWASHMIVLLGGPPSAPAAIAFVAVHLALAAAVLALPVGRWVDSAIEATSS